MDANKNNFQICMQDVEGMLSNFKNKYPRNMSDVVDNNVPRIIIAMSVLMFSSILTFNVIIGAMSLIMGPMLLSFGLKLKKLMKERNAKNANVKEITTKEMMAAVENIENTYGDYSDVKEYVKKLIVQIHLVEKHKKKLIKKFDTWYWVVIIAVGIAFFVMMVMNFKGI